MSKIDQAFIDNLRNFTDSLENIVTLLQQQSDKGGDPINSLLTPMDTQKMEDISSSLKTILKRSEENTSSILKKIDSLKKSETKKASPDVNKKSNEKIIKDEQDKHKKESGKEISKLEKTNAELTKELKNIKDKEEKEKTKLQKTNDELSKELKNSKDREEKLNVKLEQSNTKIIEQSKRNQEKIDRIEKSTADKIKNINEKNEKNEKSINKKNQDIINNLHKKKNGEGKEGKENKKSDSVISNKLDQILTYAKDSKKQKEAGLFEKIDDKGNKNKIVDGIKVIILIAAGVLAIGLAFQKVGKVDFASVIALSAGIFIISKAFANIAGVKNLTLKQTVLTGLVLVVIAASITAASIIISQNFKEMTNKQMFSFVLVGSALSVSAYFLLKGVAGLKLSGKDLLKVLLLPIILPAIAYGIAKSSGFISETKEVGWGQAKSALFTAIILAVGALSVMFLLKALKDVTVPKMLVASLMIPIIAGGIWAASLILGKVEEIKNPWGILKTSIVIGLALLIMSPVMWVIGQLKPGRMIVAGLMIPVIAMGIVWASEILQDFQVLKIPELVFIKSALSYGLALLAFAPTVWLLGKLDIKSMLIGSLAIPVVSLAIVAASWILQLGNYGDNYPKYEWSLNVGLALFIFAVPTIALGLAAMIATPLSVVIGAAMTVIVATAIMVSSLILQNGEYKDGAYPSLSWAAGVGLSLLTFTLPVIALGLLAITGIGALAIMAGAAMVTIVAQSIVDASKIIAGGNYKDGPTSEWAMGTGISMLAFGTSMALLGVIPFAGTILERGGELVNQVAQSIKDVSFILAGGNYKDGPTKDWAEGIGLSISAFAYALSVTAESGMFDKKIDTNSFSNFMISIADAMIKVANILREGKWDGAYPKKEWGEGVSAGLLPFIEAYKVMNESKSFLQGIFGGGGGDTFSVFMEGIANSMVSVADIFRGVDFSGGPNATWSKNISDALTAFNVGMGKDGLDHKKIDLIVEFADAIRDLAGAIKQLNTSGLDKLNKLTTNVTIMSVIDDKKLQDVLKVLDDNKNKLSNIIDSKGSSNPVSTRIQEMITIEKPDSKKDEKIETFQNDLLQKFDDLLKKVDDMSLKIMTEKGASTISSQTTEPTVKI